MSQPMTEPMFLSGCRKRDILRCPLNVLHSHISVNRLQHIQNMLLGEFAAVYTEVIVGHIQPLCICKIFVVGAPSFIHFFHQGASTALFPADPFHDVLYPVFKGGKNEDAFTFAFQNLICAATCDNAVTFL